jgi:hypothetical protein
MLGIDDVKADSH